MTKLDIAKNEGREKLADKICWLSSGQILHPNDIKPDIASHERAIEIALLEDLMEEMEGMDTEDVYNHGIECRGFPNQLYLKGDSLGGACTCIPVKIKDNSSLNSALATLITKYQDRIKELKS